MKIFAALAFLCTVTTSLWAQGATSLRGSITDPQKAIIPTAKITLIDAGSGGTRSAVSSQSGEYQFLQLRPGTYTLRVESPGFSPKEITGIALLVDTPSTVDVALDVASSAASVSVVAEAAQLNTVDASVGNAFQERQIQSLPLQTRNVVQLLSLQPGVTQNGEVMGARRDQNNILLDGIDNNDNQNPLSGQNGSNPSSNSGSTTQGFNSSIPVPLDSVQEFRVTVAGQAAYAGRSSGGQVSLVTRSGTNELHGSAYEYNRNTAYTANDWFNNRSGIPRAQLVRNQFGASLGGPVKKNRVFFFGNYERRIDASQQTQSRTVPSETLKQGIIQFKTTDGQTFTLSPTDVKAVDPLHIGVTSTMLGILQGYPVGNSPQTGSDGGLNFSGYLFNAPIKLDYRTYVGKFDWLVDSAGKHTVSFRGTLSNNGETKTAAQFPGQDAASQLLSDNRGFGIRYTAILAPSLTNTANVGLNRIGFVQTGSTDPSFSLGAISTTQNFARASSRINPVWNLSDDLNWIKGSHTITGGLNFRFIDNRVLNYSNSYPSYSMARGVLLGLGQDIYTAALNSVAGGNASLKLANSTAVTNAFGNVLGVLNSYSATYQFQKDGSALAFGVPRSNDFVDRNYEFYVQDSWKVTPKLTVTYGVHYEYDTVPYEVDGLQVITTPGLNQLFANRVGAQALGIPGNLLPNSDKVTYSLAGPANGKDSWYTPDKNNFAPRLSMAWAPTSKWVVRAGAGLTFDQFGNDLVNNVSSTGSLGLSTTLSNAASTDFTTSPRYGTGVLPTLPAAPTGGFPYTPPNISAISGTYVGIMPDLRAPYSYLLNGSVSRQLKDNYTLEVGYTGRLSHKTLIQQDVYSPLIYFKDPKSGINWVQANTTMRQLFNSGVTAAGVKASPDLVPSNPFVENMFPALANMYITGSASANYFYGIYGNNAGSDLDLLHQLDRVTSTKYPNCIVATGCYTFFAPQGSSNPSWSNAGFANYNAMLVTLRHSLSRGFAFDLNYTWAHSIDNGSTAASGAGRTGGVLQNAFLPGASKGDSDYDFRHLINANVTYALPFGKGKMLLNTSHKWMDEIVGGWQISSLIRVQSGAPRTISGNGVFPTNYWQSSIAIPKGANPGYGLFTDAQGNPSIFQTTGASSSYQDSYPGQTGFRGIVRLPWQRNVDLAVQKDFAMPWERHSLQFRAEAFNAFNFVNFTTISLSLSNPGTFGEFSAAQDARVLQLALRYSF